MRGRASYLAAAALLLFVRIRHPEPAGAQPAEPSATQRPRVGLVLGGGGAKGAAHVGVLRVLDDLHVPIDCVVGTSMGALVGATFAAGMSAAEIEREMLAIKWEETVGGQGRRNRTPIERKLADSTSSNAFEFGIGQRRLLTPAGFVNSQEIEQSLRSLVARAQFTRDFDELAIPFRAIATDMQKSEMVVLDRGDLSTAMRASMAVPGVFAPVVMDGRVLSDGGLMRNLPIDVARELCADVVIAVWMTSPPPDASKLSSAFTLLDRSLDVTIEANMRAQIETLTAADVAIAVPIDDIGSADFHRAPDAMKAGHAAAEAKAVELARYAVPDDEYAAWARSVGRTTVETYTLTDVRIAGTQRVNPEYVRAQLGRSMAGATVTPAQVAADTDRVFALGDFERVEYEFIGDTERGALEIDVTEKSWGPNFLRADAGLAAYEAGNIFATLRLDHARTWVNDRGGRWHNALQLGQQALMRTDFYQPLDVHERFFVHPIAHTEQRIEDLYLDGDRVAVYRIRELYGRADLGVNFGTTAQLRLGLQHGWDEAKLDTGFALPNLPQTSDTNLRLQGTYDTRDSAALPTRGLFLNMRYVRSKDWLGGEQDYSVVESVIEKAFSLRERTSLTLLAGGAKTDGDLPVSDDIKLGGIRTFPGLRPGELRGDNYWFVGTSYYWRLFDIAPLFGNAVYAGIRAQAARMDQRFASDDDAIYGLAGSLAGRTPLGPLTVSLGYVDTGAWELQLSIGRPISEGSMLDDLN